METIVSGRGRQYAIKIDHHHRLAVYGVATLHGHHEIHEGNSYVVAQSQTTANSDGNQTILSLLSGPLPTVMHMFVSASVTGAAWLYIYEGSTVVNNAGTASVTVYNRNRFIGKTSQVWDTKANPNIQNSVIFWDETDAAGGNITLAGTKIYQEQISAGNKTFAITRSTAEFNLKPNTVYAFVLENKGASANLHNIILNWYEDDFDDMIV